MNDSKQCGLARVLTFIAAFGISLGLCEVVDAARAGFDFGSDSLSLRPDGSVAFDPEFESWLGILPSFGVGWKL